MFQRLLVGLDGSEGARRAGCLALRIARSFGARLTAVYVADVRAVEGPAVETLAPLWGEISGRPLQPEILRAYRERGERILAAFSDDAETRGMTSPDTRVEVGLAHAVLLDLAAGAELVVLGRRGEHAPFSDEPLGSTAARVARASTHPVLLADGPGRVPSSPLVAYDGSDAAVHALDLAIRYAGRTGGEVRIVHASAREDGGVLATAREVLEDHGIRGEVRRIEATPAEAVRRAAEAWEADGLFIGAPGHGRLHDLVFGSDTREILAAVELPVFVTR